MFFADHSDISARDKKMTAFDPLLAFHIMAKPSGSVAAR
jgi:hypothetical protein